MTEDFGQTRLHQAPVAALTLLQGLAGQMGRVAADELLALHHDHRHPLLGQIERCAHSGDAPSDD